MSRKSVTLCVYRASLVDRMLSIRNVSVSALEHEMEESLLAFCRFIKVSTSNLVSSAPTHDTHELYVQSCLFRSASSKEKDFHLQAGNC